MKTENLKLILEQVQSGQLGVDSALDELRRLPYENLDGFATIDHHRTLRNGFPEVIFGQGKQPAQVAAIMLGVIAYRRDEATLAELILRETITLGLRVHPIDRYKAHREFRQI